MLISLAEVITSRHDLVPIQLLGNLPVLSQESDVLLWKWDKSGIYSAKSTYEMLVGGGRIDWLLIRFGNLIVLHR